MQIASLQRFFDSSPAMHLLRSPYAAWIVAFLHRQFKSSGQITWLHSALAAQLETTLHELQGESSGAPLARLSGEAYLNNWSSGDCRWLKRFIDESHSEPVYQLTPDAELALAFVSKATRAATFVGTQSHLRSILGLLQEVVDEALPEVDADTLAARIARVECEREALDRKLQQLRHAQAVDGNVAGRSASRELRTSDAERGTTLPERAHRMRSQFDLAVAQFEQLKSEFRGVEEHFKSITRGVQQRLLQTQDSRGAILEFALDAEDLLKSSDQGRSFAEFLKLVHDPASQTHLTELVRQLTQLESLADRHEELQSIRAMLPTLLAEAEKILRTTQHLSLTLRRLLDARSNRHHRQLAQLLRDIRAAASGHSETPPLDVGLEIEVELEIQLPMDRPWWSTPDPFAEVDWQLAASDPLEHAEALQQLVALQRIDWQTMRRNITLVLKSHSETTIEALLQRFPIQTGTVELLGYLQIAHEDGHEIDRSQSIELTTRWEGSQTRVFRMPRVVFHRVRRDRGNVRGAVGSDGGASGHIGEGHVGDAGAMATKSNVELNVQ